MALEVADVPRPGPRPVEPERIAVRGRAKPAAPAGDFPRNAAAAPTTTGCISTEQYLRGLRRVLDGISTRGAPT